MPIDNEKSTAYVSRATTDGGTLHPLTAASERVERASEVGLLNREKLPLIAAVPLWPRDTSCIRCGRPSRPIVLGLRWCEPCGARAAAAVRVGPFVGLGYVIAECALVQASRETVQ